MNDEDADITVLSVADGKRPRTASIFAFLTEWEVHSIDPMIEKKEYFDENIRNLECHPKKIQECDFEIDGTAVILMVHAHVSVWETLKHIKADDYVLVAMPCCEALQFPRKRGEEIIEPVDIDWDWRIFSEKRKKKKYKFTKKELEEARLKAREIWRSE